MSTDGLGYPLRLTLTAGQRHDITQATSLIDGLEYEALVADRSYDADDFLLVIASTGAVAIIPPVAIAKKRASMMSMPTGNAISSSVS